MPTWKNSWSAGRRLLTWPVAGSRPAVMPGSAATTSSPVHNRPSATSTSTGALKHSRHGQLQSRSPVFAEKATSSPKGASHQEVL